MRNSPLTIRFALDAMLGRVARHLLHTGYDCFFSSTVDDETLARTAESTGRVLVTRDQDFVTDPTLNTEVYVLRDYNLEESLRALRSAFGLVFHPDFFFTRCSRCNRPLDEVNQTEVEALIPEETGEWIDEYYQCEECDKLYWKGSHHRDLINKLNQWSLLDRSP